MDTPTRTQFTHEGIVYDVGTQPDATTPIVKEQKEAVLGSVKLDKLVRNLGITGDLIYLAYSATPPKYGALRAQIDTLHLQFGDIAGESVRELGHIKEASQEVGRKLETAFSMLYEGQEGVAMDMLALCAEDAAALAGAAGNLAAKYDALCTLADNALADSELKHGVEQTALDELMQAKDAVLAKQAGLQELQGKLAKLVADLKTEYDEAKGTLAKTEDRAFALSITGAIMQPLGQALGGAASAVALVYSSRGIPPGLTGGGGSQPAGGGTGGTAATTQPATTTPKVSAEDQKKFDDAKTQLDAAKLQDEVADDDVKTLEAVLQVKQGRLAQLPSTLKDPAVRRTAEAALQTEIGTTQRSLDDAKTAKDNTKGELARRQQEYEAVKTAVEKLGVAITTAGEKLSEMGNDYIKIAESQRDHVKQLLKVWIDKQDAEREVLAQVREVALRLENMGKQVVSSQVTVSALLQVIAAMKQVVAILHEARLFWQNMASACADLAKPKFKTEIETNAVKYPTLDRIKLFYDKPSFKLGLLRYLAKWRALEAIAEEYIQETKNVRVKVMDDFKTLLVGDKAKAKVAEMSKRLLGEVDADIKKLNAETATAEKAMAAV